MINERGHDTAATGKTIQTCAGTDEDAKYSREAAEANGYACFVQEAALRIFAADLGKVLVSDAVKYAEELADELDEQGYFHSYSPADFSVIDCRSPGRL
jgi:hypothetical protein